VTSWARRLDEEGADALVQVPVPVNRFPDFVTYVVRRLRALCPAMGTRRIATVLARAGLHLEEPRCVACCSPRPSNRSRPRPRDRCAWSRRVVPITSGTWI
jgi:hypothetical protein